MRRLLACFMIALLSSFSLVAQDAEDEGKQEKQDMEALRKWIREKRMITMKELGGDLSLSGEVRVELQGTNERKDGFAQRGRRGIRTGKDCQIAYPVYAYDVEFNLMLDYRADRTWASVKVEFDNDMGQVSGTTNKIALEKCFLGGRLLKGDTLTIDGEIGRRFLGNVFDSQIEFSSLFDGVLFRFNKASEAVGDFYTNVGALLVNDRTNHYGFVGEVGLLRIGNTGIYTKYSYIDWKVVSRRYFQSPCLSHEEEFRRKLYTNYRDSQAILGYQFTIKPWNKYFRAYIAGLMNHAAKKIDLTHYKRENLGGYAGFSIGNVLKQGDWAFNWNYQVVEAQAIPDFDCNGVKRGNAGRVGFYLIDGPDGKKIPTTSENAVGSCNYYGYAAELLYAFTSNLTVYQSFLWSHTLDKDIGPNMKYKQYEIEFIYAF